MDQKEFDEMMAKAPQPQAAEAEAEGIDFQQLANEFLSGQQPEAEAPVQAEGESTEDFLRRGSQESASDIAQSTKDSKLSDLDNPVEAFAGGVAKSVFETKDFLFGDTPAGDRSAFRAGIEEDVEAKKAEGLVNGFSAGVGQFAGAMYGLGKVGALAKALPWVGRGVTTVVEASKVVTETAKAATAGAIAFDPHEERLSNLVQGTALENPLTRWLAADPTDSAAEGRLKNALESIGMDVAIIGTLLGAGKVLKHLRAGNQSAASQAVDRLQEQQQAAVEAEQQAAVQAEQANVPTAAADLGADEAGLPAVRGADGEAAPPAVAEGVTPEPNGAAVAQLSDTPAAPLQGEGEVPSGAVREEVPGAEGGGTTLPSSDPDVTPDITSTPTAAAQAQGVDLKGTPLPKGKPAVTFGMEETETLLKQAEGDQEAILKHGGWYQAIEAGHEFGKGDGIPYRMMNTDADIDDFTARMVDAKREQMDKIKGGAVVSDAAQNRKLEAYAVAFGEDPAVVLGAVQQAGRMGNDLVARMEVGYVLAGQSLQDVWKLQQLYKLGDFTKFGTAQAMKEEIAKRMGIAGSFFAHAESLKSNFARGLRRMAFYNDYSKLKGMDMDKVMDLLDATGGDPKKFKYLTNPTIVKQLTDFAMFMRINSLVSGPKTQLINAMTNAYMVGARPLERMLGSALPAIAGDKASRSILKESMKQYAYMRSSFTEGFFLAAKSFAKNDSILSPHNAEVWQGAKKAGDLTKGAGQFFKPWDSTSNLIYNALAVAAVPIGAPTRLLGSVDELMKQTVYRSKVQARAHVEAAEAAYDAGLRGNAAKDFVKSAVEKKLLEAFDMDGRGIDPAALHEAQIATFSQDLLPNTLGKGISTLTQNNMAAKLVLPFTKTPTNVIRYGWKMTPGLNIVQREYREMLLGKMGKEMQAQAIGQMSLGALFMGSAAYLAADGQITGGGPKDPKLKQELMATGWKPYAKVRVNEDGTKTFTEFGRFDPVAIPFGIVADLQDALHNLDKSETSDEVEAAIGGTLLALAKQFTSKSYLLGATQTMEALMDPEARLSSTGGNMIASFIPYSAAMRQLNDDDYMREARSMADKVLATIPGLSEGVPARYDAFGEPIVMRKGLWSTSDDAVLDIEMQRLALESGRTPVRVNPSVGGIDLRDVTMSNGKNAYEEYQRLSGKPNPRAKPLSKVITQFVQTDRYKRAPDGDADVKGTKLWLLSKYTTKYRTAAFRALKRDPLVRQALTKESVKVRDVYRGITEDKQEPSRISKIVSVLGGG
jgi:hypothetical protein